MFLNCNSLNALYIPGINISQVNNVADLLTSQLKYLNIMGATLSDSVKNAIMTPSLSGIIICQDKNQISNTGNNDFKNKEICCNFNSENGKCESSNYITIFYPQNNNNNYQFSFSEDYSDKKGLIDFIINGESILTKNDINDIPITINQNNYQIEIHFSSNITTLEGFFSGMKDIISVDLSNFDSSYLTSVKNMFSGCTSLELVDFSNFNTEKITDMSSMFEGCSNLIFLNLNNFNTQNVTDMNSMFSGCTSLKYLDISSFNMGKVDNTEIMFEGIQALKYINLDEIKYFDKNIVENNLNKINGLRVCQKENIITNEQAIKECCLFNTTTMGCENNTTNYMILYYGK